jgi:phage regulator Rha-like protein
MNNLPFSSNGKPDGKPITNTLLAAEKFHKQHRDVLQKIRELMRTAENPLVLQMFLETRLLALKYHQCKSPKIIQW